MSDVDSRLNTTAWNMMTTRQHCYMCRKRRDLGSPMIKVQVDEHPQPSGKWLFHLYEAHGQPPQYTLTLWINSVFKNEEERSAYRRLWGVDSLIDGVDS